MFQVIKADERRLGCFRIPLRYLEVPSDLLWSFMSQVFVIDARMKYDLQAIEYLGFCEQFDWIKYGEQAPIYDVIFSYDKSGKPPYPNDVVMSKIEFKRRWLHEA